mgnify:CR=1 FL=1
MIEFDVEFLTDEAKNRMDIERYENQQGGGSLILNDEWFYDHEKFSTWYNAQDDMHTEWQGDSSNPAVEPQEQRARDTN